MENYSIMFTTNKIITKLIINPIRINSIRNLNSTKLNLNSTSSIDSSTSTTSSSTSPIPPPIASTSTSTPSTSSTLTASIEDSTIIEELKELEEEPEEEIDIRSNGKKIPSKGYRNWLNNDGQRFRNPLNGKTNWLGETVSFHNTSVSEYLV